MISPSSIDSGELFGTLNVILGDAPIPPSPDQRPTRPLFENDTMRDRDIGGFIRRMLSDNKIF